MTTLQTVSGITARIFQMPRREPFMLAADLAEVYGTSVKALNQAVSRNPDRFPADFMFSLTETETEGLRSQNVTANTISKKVRYAPLVFTHAGAYALSAVLKTPVAAEVSVIIHRAFAAMEKRALEQTVFLLQKLRSDTLAKKPIYHKIQQAARNGWTFEQLWRSTRYPRWRLEQAITEMKAMAMPDAELPEQMDMFSHGA